MEKRGLVIGKFYPFHSGHSHLIATARKQCDSVIVLVCDSPRYAVAAAKRKHWIQLTHPDVRVEIITDIGMDDDSRAWARHTINFLGFTPDVVFSSESYGKAYAEYLMAEHVMVDQKRITHPVSGTAVRKSILQQWQHLPKSTRADLALRIAVVGAESTGTTTLSKALAKHYGTVWVPEYGRLFTEGVWQTDYDWCDEDFVHIATMQQSMEHYYAGISSGIVICDTNATATQLWQQRYMGRITAEVAAIAGNDTPVLYIITGDEIPFEDDGLRDGEHIRHDMHDQFVEYMKSHKLPHSIVRGDKTTRLKHAIRAIDAVIMKHQAATFGGQTDGSIV